MLKFEILPLQGVGPVSFGMPRDVARGALSAEFHSFQKTKESKHKTDSFDPLGMHLYYTGLKPVVEFIELMYREDVAMLFKGKDVFRTKAAELYKLLLRNSKGVEEHVGSHIFSSLEMALWRSRPFDAEFDEFDRWEAVAVGKEGYYSKK